MSATDYLEESLLNHSLGIAPWEAPTSLYMALHFEDPGELGFDNEIVGDDYEPTLIEFSAWADGFCLNSITVMFSMPETSSSYFSIRANAPNGPALYTGLLSETYATISGQSLHFDLGQIIVSLD